MDRAAGLSGRAPRTCFVFAVLVLLMGCWGEVGGGGGGRNRVVGRDSLCGAHTVFPGFGSNFGPLSTHCGRRARLLPCHIPVLSLQQKAQPPHFFPHFLRFSLTCTCNSGSTGSVDESNFVQPFWKHIERAKFFWAHLSWFSGSWVLPCHLFICHAPIRP